MSKLNYRRSLFALTIIMFGWLLGTDVATDLQAAGDGSLPDMWFGVYETLAILGVSAIAGLVGYFLDGIAWASIALLMMAVFQFVGLFDTEVMISDNWTNRVGAISLMGVSILAVDTFKTWYQDTKGSRSEAPAQQGSIT